MWRAKLILLVSQPQAVSVSEVELQFRQLQPAHLYLSSNFLSPRVSNYPRLHQGFGKESPVHRIAEKAPGSPASAGGRCPSLPDEAKLVLCVFSPELTDNPRGARAWTDWPCPMESRGDMYFLFLTDVPV